MNIYTVNDRLPYTYLIGWTKLNKWYYGVRFARNCHPDDLWKKYFTSSIDVKHLYSIYGNPDVIQVRKTFSSIDAARNWEHKVLVKLNVVKDDKWLNKHYGKAFPSYQGSSHPMYGRSRSGAQNPMWNKKHSQSTRDLIKQKHHNVSGQNNPRALKWKLTAPNGDIIECNGTIETIAEQRGLGIQLLKKHLGNVVPPLKSAAHHWMSKQTVGWKLEKI